ncbi:hypothetical protein C1646_73958 [Rhizophagus diaphanus]|nr:hypothetical protein C1646_73958 [Rhizophagus diaphanus] [Rhizophagus sp. MUCL 43196]
MGKQGRFKGVLFHDYENFGTIFLFLISVIDRYEFHKNIKDVLRDDERFCYKWLIQSGSTYDIDSLDQEKSIITRLVSTLSDASQEIPRRFGSVIKNFFFTFVFITIIVIL